MENAKPFKVRITAQIPLTIRENDTFSGQDSWHFFIF